jgi:hypothetical protein
MRQSRPFCEADGRLDIQEILRLVWNPKFYCRALKSPSLVHILTRILDY